MWNKVFIILLYAIINKFIETSRGKILMPKIFNHIPAKMLIFNNIFSAHQLDVRKLAIANQLLLLIQPKRTYERRLETLLLQYYIDGVIHVEKWCSRWKVSSAYSSENVNQFHRQRKDEWKNQQRIKFSHL